MSQGTFYLSDTVGAMSIPVGTRIGTYEVAASLGAGGMGEVYARTAASKGPASGRSGALSWICSDSLVSAEITRSNASFSGIVTRTGFGNCRDLGTTVNVPINGSLTANALSFVVNVAGSQTTTLTFESTAVAAAPKDKR